MKSQPAFLPFAVAFAVTAAAFPIPAPGQVLEDFEAGPFQMTATATIPTAPAAPVPPISTGGTHYLQSFNAAAPVTATLLTGPGNDHVCLMTGEAGGRYTVTHTVNPAHRDLTVGGAYSKVVIGAGALSTVPITFGVWGAAGIETQAATPQGGGLWEVDLSSFTTVDPTDATAYEVIAAPAFLTLVTLSDVRLSRTGILSEFDFYDPGLSWTGAGEDSLSITAEPDGGTPSFEMHCIAESATGPDPTPYFIMQGINSDGAGSETPGAFPSMTLSWASPNPYTTTTFNLRFEMVPLPGGPLQLLQQAPWVVRQDSTSVEIRYVQAEVIQTVQLHNSAYAFDWEVPSGQPVHLTGVSVTELTPAPGNSSAAYRLSVTLASRGTVDPGIPLLEGRFVGDWAPGSTPTAVAEAVPPVNHPQPGLRALPSVTRERTSLRFERAVRQATTLSIFNVAGRMMRNLHVAPGVRAVSWDGRGASGERLPPGVYLASALVGDQRTTTKVVLVR